MSEWTDVAGIEEFEATDRKAVDLGRDRQCIVFKADGAYHAVGAWCSHEKASLADAEVDGVEIECARHGARFDLRTGKALSLPAVRPIARYETKLEGTRVLVRF